MPRRLLSALLALVALGAGALAVAGTPATAEPPRSASGVLEVLHEDHLDQGRSVHRYRLLGSDGSRTELLFDDRGPEGLGSRGVRVTGRQVRPGVLHVGSADAVAEAGGSSASGSTATAVSTVTKRVAVILYDFADSDHTTSRPVSAPEARDAVFGTTTPSVRTFLTETSFSQLALSGAQTTEGDVFDWVTVDAASTDACAYTSWGSEARAKAADQGFVDGNYDQVVHLMPKSTCGFGGVAYMPGKYSWTVLRAAGHPDLMKSLRNVTAHEYGHNLGIHHAGSYRCTDSTGRFVSLSNSCTLEEYNDPFSVLGMSPNGRQYHGYQKGRVGWVPSTTTITASGTYSVASISTAVSGSPQVLRIARPRAKGSSDYYYLELRQPTGDGTADSFGMTDPVVTGLSIRIAPDYGTNAISKLIDATPGSIPSPPADRSKGEGGDFTDAALPVNGVYTDSAMGLTIKLLSISPEYVAQVQVSMPTTSTRGRK